MTRINPHRPEQISPTGLKRVVLNTPLRPQEAHPPKPLRSHTNPNARLLVVAHSDRGALDDHARQTLAAAAILADAETSVVALIFGDLHEDLSDTGADELMILPELDFQIFQPDVELGLVKAVIADLNPTRIFMPDNLIGDGDLGRRLIANQQTSAATHVVEIDARHVASIHAGGSRLALCDIPEIVLLAPNAVEPELPFTAAAKSITSPPLKPITSPYQNLGLQTTVATDIALEEADFIVSAGNGVKNLATLETLAHALNASIGASRVVVDDGRLPREKQIGATGKTVNASVYVAVGISGAVQHLQGIKDCRKVIAINRDSSAPIIKRADLSVIGDAEEIMKALIVEIATAKEAAR